jgi:large subunit ribosomal protein L19
MSNDKKNALLNKAAKPITEQTLNKAEKSYPEIKPGLEIRVSEKITELNAKGEEKQRIQIFEGLVIQRKHGQGAKATITVRKVTDGVGVEKIFPINSPIIENIEVKRTFKVHRSKLGYVRGLHKKLKEIK